MIIMENKNKTKNEWMKLEAINKSDSTIRCMYITFWVDV